MGKYLWTAPSFYYLTTSLPFLLYSSPSQTLVFILLWTFSRDTSPVSAAPILKTLLYIWLAMAELSKSHKHITPSKLHAFFFLGIVWNLRHVGG